MRKQQNQAHKTALDGDTLIVLFNKPYEVLCQFSADGDKQTLAEFIRIPSVYCAGRLDFDSEGLLILTNNGKLQQAISHPRFKLPKTYWVQVEGDITDEALSQLRKGVQLNDGPTLPAEARRIDPPDVWERHPPIRERRHIPTSWIELVIKEGRNRQVRRMTAATGFPTLRLIRAAIGDWRVDELAPGEYRLLGSNALPEPLRQQLINAASATAPGHRSRARPPKRPARPSAPSSKKAPRS